MENVMQTLLLVGTLLSSSPVTIASVDNKQELDLLVQQQSQQSVELVMAQVKRETQDNFLVQAKMAINASQQYASLELATATASSAE